MKSLFASLLVLLVTPFASAQDCLTPRLLSFAVYAVEDMDVRLSDHQGLSGAGGNIRAERFLFEGDEESCLGLVSGQRLTLAHGSVRGDLEARSASLSHMDAKRGGRTATLRAIERSSVSNSSVLQKRVSALSVNHRSLQTELEEATRQLAGFSPTVHVETEGAYYLARLTSGTNVIRLNASDLESYPRLILDGPADAFVIIQLMGERVVLQHLEVVVRGALKISEIRWALPDATYLFISNTHDATFGIPGVILAPCAVTEFYEGLITGSLYVKRIVYNEKGSYHSGQVNRIPMQHDRYCRTCSGK